MRCEFGGAKAYVCRHQCVLCQLKDSMNGRDVGVDGSSYDGDGGGSDGDNLNTMFETGNDVCESKTEEKNIRKLTLFEAKNDWNEFLIPKHGCEWTSDLLQNLLVHCAVCAVCIKIICSVWKARWWRRAMMAMMMTTTTTTTTKATNEYKRRWHEVREMRQNASNNHSHNIYFKFKHFFMVFYRALFVTHSHSTNKVLLIPMFDASCAALILSLTLCLYLHLGFGLCLFSRFACSVRAGKSLWKACAFKLNSKPYTRNHQHFNTKFLVSSHLLAFCFQIRAHTTSIYPSSLMHIATHINTHTHTPSLPRSCSRERKRKAHWNAQKLTLTM